MKLWISARSMSYNSNCNRSVPSNTFHLRYLHGFQQNRTHYTKCKQRVNHSTNSYKWSFDIFFLFIPSHISRNILHFLLFDTNMNNWSNLNNTSNRNCLYRLRSTMGTNIFLGCNSYYKPFIRHSVCRPRHCTMSLGGICS